MNEGVAFRAIDAPFVEHCCDAFRNALTGVRTCELPTAEEELDADPIFRDALRSKAEENKFCGVLVGLRT